MNWTQTKQKTNITFVFFLVFWCITKMAIVFDDDCQFAFQLPASNIYQKNWNEKKENQQQPNKAKKPDQSSRTRFSIFQFRKKYSFIIQSIFFLGKKNQSVVRSDYFLFLYPVFYPRACNIQNNQNNNNNFNFDLNISFLPVICRYPR